MFTSAAFRLYRKQPRPQGFSLKGKTLGTRLYRKLITWSTKAKGLFSVDLYLPLALWTTEVKISWKMLPVCASSYERETRNVTRPGPKMGYIWNEEMVWELASSVTYGGTKFILYFKVMSARDDLQGTIFMITMLEQHCSKQCSSKVCI